MNMEEHLRRLIGDLVFTMAKLSADIDTLTEKVKALEAEKPTPPAGNGAV